MPYVGSGGCGSPSCQCSAESAVNHHEADVETTSAVGPRRGGDLESCKESDTECSGGGGGVDSLNLDCSSTMRRKHLSAPLT